MRTSPAELSPAQFRAIGHDLVDRIADFLGALPSRPVAPDTTPRAMRALLPAGGMPATGEDPALIAKESAELLFANSTFNGHPRFFGYITSSASPIGALADMLAASVNPNVGAWGLSPIATEIELQSINWIADMIGFPSPRENVPSVSSYSVQVADRVGGILVSGGNMANMVCLLAGLRAVIGADKRTRGFEMIPGLRIYASAEVHTWLVKAADTYGFGTNAIRAVPVDASLAMDFKALTRMVAEDRAAGLRPAVVVGTAGSVSTGAIDPLPEIAALCKREKLWFHVDGAYGAPAVVLADAPASLKALSLADSVAVDPHKWLYAPMEAGCALVRHARHLHDAFEFHPVYYKFEGAAEDPPVNFHEWGPQNSRGFRALKVWMTLRQVGRDGYRRMIADDCALARELHALAGAHEELEALTYSLSIATFRYVPKGPARSADELNALNTAILARLQAEGRVYVSNAVIGGTFALRACVVNFRTDSADVHALVDAVVVAGRQLSS
ncbi:MAG: aminotransferase class V-fold PLP-dependent enzyme [Gemmatimonadota bacterium]